MTRPLRLLHLSDLHFSAAGNWDRGPVLTALATYLKQALRDTPDLVAITGDIAQSGSEADYQLARKWIDQDLLPALGERFPRDNLLLVPGNHDVARGLVNPMVEMAQNSLLRAEDQNLIGELLKDPKQRDLLLDRHRHWLAFANAYREVPLEVPWWSEVREFQGCRIHLAGLDSAWMSCRRPPGESDYGRLLLSRYQTFATVCPAGAEDADLSIALLHHPWSFLAPFDAEENESLVQHHCRIVLRGHLHRQQARLVQSTETACLELAAGASYAGSQWQNAFQFLELWPKQRRAKAWFHHWRDHAWRQDKYVPNTENGRIEVSLAPAAAGKAEGGAKPAIPSAYLAWLEKHCSSVELLGAEQQQGQAITLNHIYVPAVTDTPLEVPGETGRAAAGRPRLDRDRERQALVLDHLARGSLYLPGDPGAGKSTFCRWAALLAAGRDPSDLVPRAPEGYREAAPAALRGRLPVLVPLRDFGVQLHCRPGVRQWLRSELEDALANWLDRLRPGGLDGAVLKAHLEAGTALLLLDGLDEVPVGETEGDARCYPRAALLSGLADALPTWTGAGNRVLLSSRPYGLEAADLTRLGLPHIRLAPLPEPLQDYFMQRWFHTLGRPEQAEGLSAHLAGRREGLGPLTRNPMLLTALCVIYGNGGRLPEDRYRLYERIVDQVLYNRYADDKQEREPVLARLEAVALGMHLGDPADPRRSPAAEVPCAEIDRILQDFADRGWSPQQRRVRPALYRDELLTRSGLLLPKGEDRAAFYHLSFQEYLAAEAIARGSRDQAALETVFRERAPTLEWHPTLLFLFAGAVLKRWSLDWGVDFLGRFGAEMRRDRVAADPVPARFLAAALDLVLAKGQGLPGALQADYRRICLEALEDSVPISAREPLARTLGRVGDPRLPDLADPRAWVNVPAGTFWMGAQKQDRNAPHYDPEAYDDEAPPHQVSLDAYRIARYPVTVAQFGEFIAAGGYGEARWWTAGRYGKYQAPRNWESQLRTPNCPVTGVSWYEAMAWCAWQDARLRRASEGEGRVGIGEREQLRLLTEAEWERAARGTEARRWPWGPKPPDAERANYRMNVGRPTPVGIYPNGASPEGVQDLAGNVWEWCLDGFDDKYYQKCQQRGVVDNPVGPVDASSRLLRGGSFWDGAGHLRGAIRDWIDPVGRDVDYGFRCALGPRRQLAS